MDKKTKLFPRLGMRNIKTAICVLICLVLGYLLSGEITLYSSIAAIVCIQSTIENTLRIGLYRLAGTAVGGGFGMLIMFLIHSQNVASPLPYFLLLPSGLVVIVYLCNLIRMQGSVVICAIVYISVLASPLVIGTVGDPYIMALFRVSDTAIGVVVAMAVNRFIAPPSIFEAKRAHLVCDDYTEIYEHIKDKLTGDEELILYDSSLTQPSEDYRPASIHIRDDLHLTVRMPVPLEYKDMDTIRAAYITPGYKVAPMSLEQSCGYVELPSHVFPCTVVWKMKDSEGIITSILK